MTTGKLIVFTGPSGVGKATVEKFLFKKPELNLGFSVSATTRQPRPNEENGKHYHFITKEKFNSLIKENKFIENSEHFNNKYGTFKEEVFKIINSGKNAFLEIEPNGAKQIIKKENELNLSLITIFLTPPSIKSLENRIRKRGTESESQIKQRLARAKEEMSYANIFQYSIINNKPEEAAEEIAKIIIGKEK
ncbi:MAG: guanylate kinase [Mycoplasma sp.]|nr:guanylate kinase [Mycoplasma sp.]